MVTLIRMLVAHKADATETLLAQVLGSRPATADREIRRLLNHILVSNRFWSALIRDVSFDVTREAQVDLAPDDLPAAFREVEHAERAWLEAASEADTERRLAHPLIPGRACTIAEAFTQVCLHTHGHRAQLLTMLRRHGVVPEAHDFIVWLASQPRTGETSGEPAGHPRDDAADSSASPDTRGSNGA